MVIFRFLCPICQDVFTDPVSTPCGHNFCKNCISEHWDCRAHCECPNCKKLFNIRPVLQVNSLITEMVSHIKESLIDPVENLEGRMCMKHDKLLELFCKVDQRCVCMFCSFSDHKQHEVVPLKDECEGRKAELAKTEAELQQMIQQRQLKIEEIKQSVLTRLRDAIERNQTEAIKWIQSKHTLIEKQAVGFIKELEQELCELKKKSAELEQLSLSEDHLRLLQNLPSLKAAPPTKDWTEVRVRSPSYEGNMRSASAPLVEMLIIELKKLLPKTELRTARQSAVDVTLDPDTAHCQLLLSGDGEQVCHPKYGDVNKKLPDNPKRFSTGLCVVGKQVISTGRFYFEVQVKGKTQWVIGVAKESINRKGLLYIVPQNGYWTLGLRKENEYYAPACRLNSKSQPEKVGVFVDYEEGLVLFYDVDASHLIHAFTGCSFTERLLPFFCPSSNQGGKNSFRFYLMQIFAS
uniref:Uncharacterized protein n=1 Tax=Sparus aurata TaxID=8175 RepID=A0A671W4B0_SPAAU